MASTTAMSPPHLPRPQSSTGTNSGNFAATSTATTTPGMRRSASHQQPSIISHTPPYTHVNNYPDQDVQMSANSPDLGLAQQTSSRDAFMYNTTSTAASTPSSRPNLYSSLSTNSASKVVTSSSSSTVDGPPVSTRKRPRRATDADISAAKSPLVSTHGYSSATIRAGGNVSANAQASAGGSEESTLGSSSQVREETEADRQRAVDKVLRRAEAAKMTRNFKNRLALATFKAARGWHTVGLDVIEPHLEQEAMLRRQQQRQRVFQHEHDPYANMASMGGGGASHGFQSAYPGNTTAPPAGGISNGLAFGGEVAMNSAQGTQRSPYAASTAFLPYPSGPGAGPGPFSSNMDGGADGSTRSASKRRYQAQQSHHFQAQPLSSADPTFSSFVDAAAALTGLSRGPSDASIHSSASAESTSGTAGALTGSQSQHPARPRTPDGNKGKGSAAAGMHGGLAASGLGGVGAGAGGESSSAEGAAELMLFLAASPSPVRGPARRDDGHEAGENGAASGPTFSMPMRGRKLFGPGGLGDQNDDDADGGRTGGSSGGRMAASSPFKPHSAAAQAAAAEEPAAARGGYSSPQHFGGHHQHLLPEPTKSGSGPFGSQSNGGGLGPAASLGYGFLTSGPTSMMTGSGGPHSMSNPPATPGRDRQPSANGWESFINVSPSPQRPPRDRDQQQSDTGAGTTDKLLGAGRKLAEMLGGGGGGGGGASSGVGDGADGKLEGGPDSADDGKSGVAPGSKISADSDRVGGDLGEDVNTDGQSSQSREGRAEVAETVVAAAT